MHTLKKCRINVMVSNMGASITFYTNVLGLELVNQYGNHYAEIQGPGLMIGLHPLSARTTVGNNLSIGFGVGDFDSTLENLRSKGVELKVEQDGWIRLAYFHDLDNNSLFLAENKD